MTRLHFKDKLCPKCGCWPHQGGHLDGCSRSATSPLGGLGLCVRCFRYGSGHVGTHIKRWRDVGA